MSTHQKSNGTGTNKFGTHTNPGKGVRGALNPTNHATIQSLVHAIGAQPDVPAPCCVPDHLSPMTLLYMDEAGNVVLKNYPSMTVDSCACR
uniref:(California timema) hypothetical protein n=1 Tax=Timema californicum TaxID=61474 RepID=A0A7R9IWI2_TIMCA|nr:unnamed protein product [Timema californicum]